VGFSILPCWHKDKMLRMISRRLLLGDFGSALKARKQVARFIEEPVFPILRERPL